MEPVRYVDKDADLAVVKIDKIDLLIVTFAKENTISVEDTVITTIYKELYTCYDFSFILDKIKGKNGSFLLISPITERG